MGDLKGDAAPRLALPETWTATLAGLQGAPLIVAGSTHAPEEGWVLEALHCVRRRWPGTRLLLAPRHPARAAGVSRRAAATGFETVRWSDPTALSGTWDVLVLDRIGLLAAIYRYADVVVVGGSLVRRGGHNPLEAAGHGRPIVIGPSFEHFSEVVAGLAAAAGVLVLPSGRDVTDALAAALLELLGDPARRVEMGTRALEYARSRRGVARRYAQRALATLAAAQ
jgi:3-deoxy-D-manno-octulosonic-acid transferase